MRFVSLAVLAGTMLTVPDVVHAQGQFLHDNLSKMVRKVGVHVNTSFRKPVDPDVTKGITFGASVGLSPGRTDGWRFPIGLGMYSEYLHAPTGRQFGVFQTRALMAGFGYGWHVGRLSTGASMQAGWGINRAVARGDAAQAFDVLSGGVYVQVHNAMLFRPQIKAEYFLTERFTLRVSADYVRTRPDILVLIPSGPSSDHWNVSSLHANLGIGVYPFRR